ncbi:hypothetical protein BD769DRAFT_1388438 [Suillus cothurnatus]|nr:hypothetical protein BD769DRAFT_1388438 [Suillus cothurnatus]
MWLLVETEGIMKVEMMEVEVTEVMVVVVVVVEEEEEEVVVEEVEVVVVMVAVAVAVVVGGGNSLPPAGPPPQRWVHRIETVTCGYVVTYDNVNIKKKCTEIFKLTLVAVMVAVLHINSPAWALLRFSHLSLCHVSAIHLDKAILVLYSTISSFKSFLANVHIWYYYTPRCLRSSSLATTKIGVEILSRKNSESSMSVLIASVDDAHTTVTSHLYLGLDGFKRERLSLPRDIEMREAKQKAPYRELRHATLLQFPVKPAQIASDKGLRLHLTESVSIVLSLYPVGSALKTFKGPHINHGLYRSGVPSNTCFASSGPVILVARQGPPSELPNEHAPEILRESLKFCVGRKARENKRMDSGED